MGRLKQFLLRKFVSLIFVALGITVIAFLLGVLSPGDPAELALSGGGIYSPTPEQIELKRAELGLDRPIHIQYFKWIKGLSKGELGVSHQSNEAVKEIFARRLPVTLKVAIISLIITIFSGIIFGMLAAIYANTTIDYIISGFANIILSLPSFWIALMGIFIFSEILGLLPTSGQATAKHFILPCVSLSCVTSAISIRLMRSSMLQEFGKHYVLVARARGVKGFNLYVKNILPQAILPLIPVFANFFGAILGGSAVIENIFSLPGLGHYALEAVRIKDYPFLQFYVMLSGIIFVLVTTFAEVLGMILDPRVRVGGSIENR